MGQMTDKKIDTLSPQQRGNWLSLLLTNKKHAHIEYKMPVIKKMLAAGATFSDKEKERLIHFIVQTPARALLPEFLAAGIKPGTTFEGYQAVDRAVMAHDAVTLKTLLATGDPAFYQDVRERLIKTAARNLDTACVEVLAETLLTAEEGQTKPDLNDVLVCCACASLTESSALAPNPRKALYLKRQTMFKLMNFGAELPSNIDYYDLESGSPSWLKKEDFFAKVKHPEALEIEAEYKKRQEDLKKGLKDGFAATQKIVKPGMTFAKPRTIKF